jgi:YidC/Oxa1 family membrane protein insertase
VPEQKVELKNDTVLYTFTTKGGGLVTAELLDTEDHVKLNDRGKLAIGNVSSSRLGADLDYKITAQNGNSVAFEAETSDHLVIRKEYRFSQGPGSDPHLLEFKLSFANKSEGRLARGEQYLYTGAAASLRPDEILRPTYIWNDAGDVADRAPEKFDSGWFGWKPAVPDIT